MMTNHKTVTLFCSKTVGRSTRWIRAILRDVNIHETDQLLIGDKEVKASDELVIRIPADRLVNYVDTFTWKGLSAEEALSYFTLKKGDYIVQGEISEDISSSSELLTGYSPFEIVKVTDNLSASKYSAHIKLVVK